MIAIVWHFDVKSGKERAFEKQCTKSIARMSLSACSPDSMSPIEPALPGRSERA
jgi:hypothetical protein